MRRRHMAAWLLIAGYVTVALFTVLDYGISWDEKVQATYGEMSVRYYESGFRERAHESFWNLRYYGPFFEMLPALVYRHAPWWKFEIRHLFIVAFAVAGLFATKRVADTVEAGGWTAIFAVASLLLMPAFYGHTFFNSKDIPFAALFACAVLASLRMLARPAWSTAALAGTIAGLMLGVRVGGVLLFGILLIAIVVMRTDVRRRISFLAFSGLIAWLVMTLVWPWAQANPITHPLESLRAASSFGDIYDVLFAGRYWPSNRLPLRYLTQMFLVTTPLPILTLIAVGTIVLARARSKAATVVLLWAFTPPLLQAALHAPVYDSTRHFLFVYPAMAILAGCGATALIAVSARRSIAIAAILAALATTLPAMIRLHPYEYVYYNALAGGTGGASGHYELDYWTTSYREAALWLGDHVCESHPTRVLLSADAFNDVAFTWFLPRGLDVKLFQSYAQGNLPPGWDYYVGPARQRLEQNFSRAPLAYRVERDGATLAIIRGACR